MTKLKEHLHAHKEKYRTHFTHKEFRNSCITAVVLILVSLVVNYYAAGYALEHKSNYVTDIVLSNIQTLNVSFIFTFGPVFFWAVIAVFCVHEPKRIPFVLKSIAAFVLVRSAFITMTHIGPSPDQIAPHIFDWNLLNTFTSSTNFFLFSSGGDLFFSGHTGLPFLMALVFWDYKPVRIFSLVSAIIFGVVVLLGHYHYTIDVASAFFITYTIYHLVRKFFPTDYAFFRS